MLTLGRSANAGILTAYQDVLGSAVGISIRHCKTRLPHARNWKPVAADNLARDAVDYSVLRALCLECRIQFCALFEHECAPVAQWIEQLTSDQQVGGSNPSGRATPYRTSGCCPQDVGADVSEARHDHCPESDARRRRRAQSELHGEHHTDNQMLASELAGGARPDWGSGAARQSPRGESRPPRCRPLLEPDWRPPAAP